MAKPDYKALIGEKNSNGDIHYTEIGAAWKNENGTIGVRLKANPVNGDFVLCAPKDDDKS